MLLGLATTVKLPDQNCYSAIYINKIVALNILMVYGLMRGWIAWHVMSPHLQNKAFLVSERKRFRRKEFILPSSKIFLAC